MEHRKIKRLLWRGSAAGGRDTSLTRLLNCKRLLAQFTLLSSISAGRRLMGAFLPALFAFWKGGMGYVLS